MKLLIQFSTGNLFLFLVFCLLMGASQISVGATIGDYRSVKSGNWGKLDTWQRLNILPDTWIEPTSAQGFPGEKEGTKNVLIQGNTVDFFGQKVPFSIESLTFGSSTDRGILNFTNNPSSLTIKGNVNIINGDFMVINAGGNTLHNLTIGGNISMDNGQFNMKDNGGCVVTMNGNTLQTINGTGGNYFFFDLLIQNKVGVKISHDNAIFMRNLTIDTDCTLDIAATKFNKTSSPDATVTLNTGSKLRLAGTSGKISNFGGADGSNFPCRVSSESTTGTLNYLIHPNSTVEYYGNGETTQTVCSSYTTGTTSKTKDIIYGHLLLTNEGDNGDATKILTTNLATIVGNLIIGDFTTFDAGSYTFPVNGTTTIGNGTNGKLTMKAAPLSRLFTGRVTIATGGIWDNNGISAVEFKGGITNKGTFNAGTGIHTFYTNDQALAGTFSIPKMTVTAIKLTNNDILTIEADLLGTGELVNAATGILNLGGTSTITGLTASAAGNIVNYTGVEQTVKAIAYSNLSFSGTGAKSITAGTTSIAKNLSIYNTIAKASIFNGLTINAGTLTLGILKKRDGTWGSTASAATNKNDDYFTGTTTGIVAVSNDTRLTPAFSGLTDNRAVCLGSTETLTGTISYGNSIYPAAGEQVSVSINGNTQNATILGSNGGFSISYNTIGIPGSATAYPITYSYKGNENLKSISDNSSRTLNINSIPAVTSNATGSICSGASQNYDITSKVNNTTYNWSRAVMNGIINEAVTNQTSNPITEVLNNSTTSALNVKYIITPIANGCSGLPFTYTVTVEPTPEIKPMSTSTCSGSEFTVSPNSDPTNRVPIETTYSWPIPEGSGFSGGEAGINAADIRGTITNKTNTPQVVTYIVTARSGAADYIGNTFPVTITINPIAQIPDFSFEVFSGVPFDTILINNRNGIIPEGTSYRWSGPTNPKISGGSSGSDAKSFNVTLTNNTNETQTTIYSITPFSRYSITPLTLGCFGSEFTIKVTVDINKWTGRVSNDWNNEANWSENKVLNENANLVFTEHPGFSCYMDKEHTVKDITIQDNHLLSTNGYKLNIRGKIYLTNGGQIDASATGSTVEFNGSVTQDLPSETFLDNKVYNLTIHNKNNVKLNGTLKVLNNLTDISGKLDTGTGSNTPTVIYGGEAAQKIDSNPFLNNEVLYLTIDNDVTLNTDLIVIKNLIINPGKRLTISTNSELNVKEMIQNKAGVTGLVIKAGQEQVNGTLIFHNPQTAGLYVPATVEMYSKAYRDKESPFKYKWQFFGIPIRKLEKASPTLDGSYVRQMYETGITDTDHWIQLKNNSTLSSFTGYEITQANPTTVSFQGELENKDWTSDELSNTYGAKFKGQHLIGNPYTAAIDISKIEFDSSNLLTIDNTVNLYNTGSKDDWNTANTAEIALDWNSLLAGQYISIPKNVAGREASLPGKISSMQAFLIRLKGDYSTAKIFIPYSSTSSDVKNSELQHTPATGKVSTRIDVKGRRFSDRMWIFTEPGCTRGFDNGWDGEKMLGSPLSPQLYAMEAGGDYQVNSVDDINNTYLGFQPGEDLQDTLTFTHENLGMRYEGLYLLDLAENKAIDVTQSGTKYIFSTGISLELIKRFKIITSPTFGDSTDVTTGLRIFSSQGTVFVHNMSNENGYVLLYDMAGRMLQKLFFEASGVTSFPMNLTPGAYIAKVRTSKEEITKRLVIPQNEK